MTPDFSGWDATLVVTGLWVLSTAVLMALWYRADRRSAARHAADVHEFDPARADYPYLKAAGCPPPRRFLKYWHDVRIERDKLHREVETLRTDLHSARRTEHATDQLRTLGKVFHARSVASGFWPEYVLPKGRFTVSPAHVAHQREWIGLQLALIHSEIAEATEALRDGKLAMHTVAGKPEGLVVELMDALIRILDLCEGLGLDSAAACKAKHEYNLTRPRLHGRQC